MKEIIVASQKLLQKSVIRRQSYFDTLTKYAQTNEILVVVGQRRVGKSSIVRDFLQGKNALYLNKEIDVHGDLVNARDLQSLVDEWIGEYGTPDFVVVDEIQDIQDWQIVIRAWRAKNEFRTIITGSNSTLLSGELGTYLTGRYFEITVWGLSFQEFCHFSGKQESDETFDQYCLLGGLPELHFLPQDSDIQNKYIQYIRESIMYKDVLQRMGSGNVGLMERIAKFLADSLGFEISINKIAQTLTSNGQKTTGVTVGTYIQMLTNALLIDTVTRYDLQGKKILSYGEKMYFTDHGIRNVRGFAYQKHIGQILENIVYIELKRRGYTVYVGKIYDREVDFIASEGEKTYAIQVAYLLHEGNEEREIGNLKKIQQSFPKYIITMNPGRSHRIDAEGIEYFHILNWLKMLG